VPLDIRFGDYPGQPDDNINLLKIDAEKSELYILKGIDDRDWPKIAQIVIEIHDRKRELASGFDSADEKGYRCAVEQEKLLEHSGLFISMRPSRGRSRDCSPSTGRDGVAAAGINRSAPEAGV